MYLFVSIFLHVQTIEPRTDQNRSNFIGDGLRSLMRDSESQITFIIEDGQAGRVESDFTRNENELLPSSLERSGLLAERTKDRPTDQNLLVTDYDRCSMTQSHGSHFILEMGKHGEWRAIFPGTRTNTSLFS